MGFKSLSKDFLNYKDYKDSMIMIFYITEKYIHIILIMNFVKSGY